MKKQLVPHALATALALTMITPASAAPTLKVAPYGVDAVGCGAEAAPPCATIAQAITNAVAGDAILVEPGQYVGALTVNKSITLISTAGSALTIIQGPVSLDANEIVFGKARKGFTVAEGGANPLITIVGQDVTVRGNLLDRGSLSISTTGTGAMVRGNRILAVPLGIEVKAPNVTVRANEIVGGNGIEVEATASFALIDSNRIADSDMFGIALTGVSNVAKRNHILRSAGVGIYGSGNDGQLIENTVIDAGNSGYAIQMGTGWSLIHNLASRAALHGFQLDSATTYNLEGNMAIGNAGVGIQIIAGTGHLLVDNSAINNVMAGIVILSSANVSGGNLYGNGGGNCGIFSNQALTMQGIFWGAASGPGADPADMTCGSAGTDTQPAPEPAKLKAPKGN